MTKMTVISVNTTEEAITETQTARETETVEISNLEGNVFDIENFEMTAQYIVLSIIFIGLITSISAKLYHELGKRGSDACDFAALFLFFQSIADFISDIFFAIILYFENEMNLFLLSCSCTLIPFVVSWIVGLYWMERWRLRQEKTGRLKKWLSSHDTLFALLVVFCGFYPTVSILRSKIFNMERFNLPLKKQEYLGLKHYKFLNVVLLENIPQFIISIYYIVTMNNNDPSHDHDENTTPIVFLSMILSALSIVLLIFSQLSRVCQLCRPQQEKYASKIVIEACLSIKSKKLRTQHGFSNKKIETCIFDVLTHSNDNEISEMCNRSDISVDVECFYILATIKTFHIIKAYFEVTIMTHDTLKIQNLFYDNISNMDTKQHPNNSSLVKALKSILKINDKKPGTQGLTIKISDMNTYTTNFSHNLQKDRSIVIASPASHGSSVNVPNVNINVLKPSISDVSYVESKTGEQCDGFTNNKYGMHKIDKIEKIDENSKDNAYGNSEPGTQSDTNSGTAKTDDIIIDEDSDSPIEGHRMSQVTYITPMSIADGLPI